MSQPTPRKTDVLQKRISDALLGDPDRKASTRAGSGTSTDITSFRCPSHDDERPSAWMQDGKWSCPSCQIKRQSLESLAKLLRLPATNGNGNKNSEHAASATAPRSSSAASYDYTDEAGSPLYQVVRKDPKAFLQRHRCSEGDKEGWTYSLGGVPKKCSCPAIPLVLFNLPRVLAGMKEGVCIWVVEGEKDVRAIQDAGGVATCNPMGAGKWRPEFSEVLRGAKVRVVADRDDAGRKHAQQVAASLKGIAASVEVVEARTGKDASDHLAAGHTLEDFEPQTGEPDPSADPTQTEVIDTLNKRLFVARLGGSTVIASVEKDAQLDREYLGFTRANDLKLFYLNRRVVVGKTKAGAEITVSEADFWLSHPRRRTYDRIDLIPSGPVPPGTFNLWRGWGVDPQPGSWDTIREHLLHIICSGIEVLFKWLLCWMARCVQHPELQAEVAVLLRGKKGTGKGAFARIMLALFKNHGLHISNSRHLVGHFNKHLADALFLFLDEAYWAGDKAAEGTLKALITERTFLVEPKGIDSFTVPNRLKLAMASNNERVAPVTADERRFLGLDVSPSRMGDSAYFKRLFSAIEGALELPALLHDLLAMDLSDFDHRHPPHTESLNEQKLIGADSFKKFWLDCLNSGEIILTGRQLDVKPEEDGFGEFHLVDGWPEDIVAQDLHRRYVDHAHRHGDRHPISDAEMGKALSELIPGLKTTRPKKPWGDQEKPKRYLLPDLDSCRASFLSAMNIAHYKWPDVL